MNSSKSTKGFTLMELLVVMALLGIIGIVAVPAFGATLRNARDNNIRSYAQALVNQLNAFNAVAVSRADVIDSKDFLTAPGVFNGRSPAIIRTNDDGISMQHRRGGLTGQTEGFPSDRYSGIGVGPSGLGLPFSVSFSGTITRAEVIEDVIFCPIRRRWELE